MFTKKQFNIFFLQKKKIKICVSFFSLKKKENNVVGQKTTLYRYFVSFKK